MNRDVSSRTAEAQVIMPIMVRARTAHLTSQIGAGIDNSKGRINAGTVRSRDDRIIDT